MSKTVDERVVSMKFDNSHFEKNVKTSMSTIDKLKQKLNLSGASKGLENINASAKKVDMSVLSNGVESVRAKFSALDVMAVTALANITNSAVNAGKRIVSAMTIDPVMDGFREYETQMNAVQTILANTQKEGTNVQIVNKYLDELNSYADKTIYNFTEMTRNIGTFTAAGVKLDTSVSAIKGIANLAAVSGSNSQQASTAMYQLSQAIAAGTVKLMDWNSVVNAGMGGQVFQDALVRTSEHLQTGAKGAIAAEGSFRESLKTGWLTTEVLTQTLDQFATAADTQKEYEAAVKKFVDQGYTQEEAKQMADMAKTAGEAATKVKTFTQLIDTLKEALGSGWAKTWQLIIGDFEEAKSLWTGVSDVLSEFINKMSDARNKLLESALGKGFTSLSEKLTSVTKPAEKAIEVIEDLGSVVDDVILGKFGNGQERFNALTEAGYNYYKVQNKVNETLNNGYRYTDEQIASQDELLKSQGKVINGTKEESSETSKLTDEKKELIKKVASMTEEQMRSKGYTDEQIEAFKELGETADKLGMPLNEFIDNMDQITGRWLLINSFKNIGESIVKTFKAIGDAWRETFEPMSSDTLFNIMAGFHKFTMSIKLTDEGADKLKRTFKGLFAILDIITTITGSGLKLAFKVLSTVLGAFDMSVLDLTAILGDMIVKFRDFLFDNGAITKGFELLASGVKMAIEAFKDFYETVKNIPKVQEIINSIKNIDLKEVGKNILAGLKNGLKDGVTTIPKMLVEIGSKLLEAIKDVLGIHSPSKEMYDVGGNVIDGLVNGIKDGFGKVWNVISNLGSSMLDWINNFDWSKALSIAISAGLLIIAKKMADTLSNITAPLAGLGDLLSGAGSVLEESSKGVGKILNNTAKVVKSFSKVLNAQAFKMKAAAIKDLAISIGILAASVYLLAQLDPGKLWNAVGALTVLTLVMGILAFAVGKMSDSSMSISKSGIDFKGVKTCLLQLGICLLLMAETVKILGAMNPDQAKQGFIGLGGLVAAIVGVLIAFGQLVKGKPAQNIDKVGKMMLKMSIALLLMVGVVKLISKLEPGEMGKGALFLGGFIAFCALLAKVTTISGKGIDKLGGMMLKISIALMLMVGVVKLISLLEPSEMIKGAIFLGGFIVFVGALMTVSKIGKDKEIAKIGGLVLKISIALMLMVGVVKLISLLEPSEMFKGALFVAGFVIFVGVLVGITRIGKEEQIAKVAGTILAMSVAIGIMAGVCIILGLIDLGALAKGVIAVGVLGVILKGLIIATKGAEDCKGNIIAMSVAIGIMAAAVAALSFIDPTKLAGAVAALTVLMGMFAILELANSKVTGSMGTLIVMTLAITILSTALYLLAGLPLEQTLAAATSLSLVLMAFSASLVIISNFASNATLAMPAIVIMTLVVAALGGVLYLLAGLPVESTLAAVASLSILLLAISGAMVILSLIPAAAAIQGALGLSAFVGIMAALLVVIGGLSKIPGIPELISSGGETLAMIGYAIGNFVGSIIGGFGAGLSSGLPEIGTNLSLFIINATPFLAGIKMIDAGSLVANVGALTAAILLLTAADLITGIASLLQLGSSLSDLGTEISQFMINATPFIAGASMLNESVMAGVKTLAETILILTAADLLDGITSWITGGSSISDFAKQLTPFGEAMVAFSNTVSGNIDEGAVTAAANAGKIMADMADKIPNSGGLVGFFAGENDMSTFGIQMVSFGASMVAFSKTVSGNIDEGAVTAAANAGKIMIDMAEKIPNTGGLVSFFTGDNDMATFGLQIKSFGESIKSFSNTVSGNINEDAVTAAANAGKTMVELQKTIPNTGGLVSFLTGDNNMATFGQQIKLFGGAIVAFSKTVSGNINEEAVSTAAKCGEMMATLNKAIPDSGGIKSLWSGDNTLEDFGDNMVDFGEAMVDFSESVSEGVNEKAATAAIKIAEKINDLAIIIGKGDYKGFANFNDYVADNLEDLGSSLSDFSESVSEGLNSKAIDSAVKSCKSLISMAKEVNGVDFTVLKTFADTLNKLADDMAKVDVSGMATFSKKLGEIGKTGVDKLINTFKNAGPKAVSAGKEIIQNISKGVQQGTSVLNKSFDNSLKSALKVVKSYHSKFISAGKALMTQLANGIKEHKSKVSAAMKSATRSSVSDVRDYYDNFYNAGSHLVSGFAKGISENTYKAKAKAKAMAEKAYEAAKEALDINSPSKVFRRLGYCVPEGFAQGIDRMGKYVENSSMSMAKTAINGTENALSRITDVINGNIDSQPTIRPVLDLTDVKNNARSINGIFGNDISVGLGANVRAINSMMNENNQNGNDDVVAAINKLNKSISNLERPSYTVNGLTYDDGSNIAGAVQSLVRAARIERRV